MINEEKEVNETTSVPENDSTSENTNTEESNTESSESTSNNTLTAFEVEKIVEMKVNEMISKLKNADNVEKEESEVSTVEEDVEF